MKYGFLLFFSFIFTGQAYADFGLYCYGPVKKSSGLYTPTGIYIVDIGDGTEAYIEEFREYNEPVYYSAKRIKKTDSEYTYYSFHEHLDGSKTHYDYIVSRKANYIKRHSYSDPKRKNNGAYYWLKHKKCNQISIIDMERIADMTKKAQQKRIQMKKKREQQKIERDRVKF